VSTTRIPARTRLLARSVAPVRSSAMQPSVIFFILPSHRPPLQAGTLMLGSLFGFHVRPADLTCERLRSSQDEGLSYVFGHMPLNLQARRKISEIAGTQSQRISVLGCDDCLALKNHDEFVPRVIPGEFTGSALPNALRYHLIWRLSCGPGSRYRLSLGYECGWNWSIAELTCRGCISLCC
jgi:hypothetical protein